MRKSGEIEAILKNVSFPKTVFHVRSDLVAPYLQIEMLGTCNNTGYKGRVALYEVMRFTDNLKEMVLQGGSTAELKMAAIKNGMMTLRMSGIQKVLDARMTLAGP